MSKAMRQMPQQCGRAGVTHGEAARDPASDEASGPPREHLDTGSARPKAGAGSLLEAALTRENLNTAWKRIKANKGAAGVDGLDIEQTAELLRTRWSGIRQALLAGTYRPQPVRRVMIPKPDGSQRELGIPTVLDRLIQQAVLQVLQPLIDPSFSEHSHGLRPGRRAHDAVKAARAYVQSGKRVVVDVDLARFFDRVNHDILIDRLQKRIEDAAVIRLVRAYLRKQYARLKLQINEAKSAVASALGRKFLGYALWVAKGREVKCAVAHKAVDDFKARIRQLTRRTVGRSMAQVVDKLRPYLLGWKAYFAMAQTPRVWRALDEWLRHRLRAIQLRHWKRPKTIYRELKALGASQDVAKQVAGNCHRWWRNSGMLLNKVLTIAYFDRLGLPRLS